MKSARLILARSGYSTVMDLAVLGEAIPRIVLLRAAQARGDACSRVISISSHLQPTELANEAAVRVLKLDRMEWKDRAHFLATAATVMRQALLDEVRRFRADKRQMPPVMTTFVDPGIPTIELDLEKLDASLRRLAAVLPENARAGGAEILRGPYDRSLRRRAQHLGCDGQATLGRVPRLAAARPATNMNLERERQLLQLVEEALAWPPETRESPPAGAHRGRLRSSKKCGRCSRRPTP